MDLNLVQLKFEVKVRNADANIASLYQALRRFDLLFRQTCCRYGSKTCLACKEQSACAYRNVFAQELSSDPDIVRRHQKPPLPFAFKISQLHDDSSCLEIGLVVAGNAINHLHIFIETVRRLIESTCEQYPDVSLDLSGIYCLDYQSVCHELDLSTCEIQNLIVLSSLEIMTNSTGAENVRLILESPLRLLSTGTLLHSFDFSVFLRSQLRRCSSLFAYYGNGELDIDFAGLSAAVSNVKCFNDGIRYLQPSWSQRHSHGGLLGISKFGGISTGMMPLLILGSYFNAGKIASYGQGAYRIEAA